MAHNPPEKTPSADLLKVEEARRALGISRRRLAIEAGVSDSVISKALAGKRGIGPESLNKLVDAVERLSLKAKVRRNRLDTIINQERNAA